MIATTATRPQSMLVSRDRLAHDRRITVLLERRGNAEDDERESLPRHTHPDTWIAGTPAIHIIVVVVSPTTLPAPPAFDAATIAAR